MPGVSNSHNQDVDIDLGHLFRAVWQRRRRILMATAAVAGIAFATASMITPSYRSETRLLIEPRAPAFATRDTAGVDSQVLDELNIASQVQVLQSVDLIKQVARDMKLYELKEFDPQANPSALSEILVLVGLRKNPLDMAPEERVIKEFTERLQVYQVERSRVIGIQFTSSDPKLAAAIPNKIAEVYQALQSGAKLDSNSEATRWLEPEIANLRDKVREAERKVADYRSDADLLPTTNAANFAGQQLNDISGELARVRGERATAEARAASVRDVIEAGRPADTLTDVVGSQMIQRLKETEANLQGQIADLSTTMLEGHPRLKGLRAQLAGIRRQIDEETRKILSSLENEAKVAQRREGQLVQQLNQIKADSARAGEDEVGLKALEREAAAQRQLLETYLARYREASSRSDQNSSPADARVISNAVVPTEPHFPKVIPIVIVASLATLIISSAIILLLELFSGRALRPTAASRSGSGFDGDDSQQETDAHFAASSMLAFAGTDGHAEAGEEDSEYSVRSVAAYLKETGINLAISISPSGDDGSTATVMLAREIADAGSKTVLLDMTGTACPTRLMADSADFPGITDLLTGEAAFADTIHQDRLSAAHIIPHGNADTKLAMRGANRLSIVIDALSNTYDVVLVECGPASIQSVAKLTQGKPASIILSVPDPKEEELVELFQAFGDAGYEDLVLMSASRSSGRSDPGKEAA
ncbi:exopolysaccharide transport family protein [Rhizobiaceae bacterium n13]|uniref:Exopolysaccharide transport family protein n=1 Tax=Ferirhizobium litorale TaxID=2927786 RepID=A0AAE3QA85_9HYPH|nr:exopolysaccharide transport family protein [Fererhizobium litorale]MDI7861004.1 exopolysaccharide transport family protein [Fererhizobium litorale]MDI7921151.1 exopolysaccharide transport family protein [Fererhizobium litorale]